MQSPLLSLTNIAIGFGSGPDVLRHTDLQVREGEFVTVIGPSGCGKSTILNATAGLLTVRSGTVTFGGEPVRGVNTGVGYMTQGDTLLPWRTVYDNVAMPLRLRRVARSEVRTRVDSMLAMLDLSDAVGKYPAQLSGGMKRRALLARSMVYEPKLLLMDEPFAALDAQLRTQLHHELRRSVAILKQTVLFITHDVFEAVLLSDRVVVLGGKPTRPVAEITVPFGAERDIRGLRFDPEFVRLEKSVHDALAEARPQSGRTA